MSKYVDVCAASALDDEPIFTLLARDANAPSTLRHWAQMREMAIENGEAPERDQGKVVHARAMARHFEKWRIDHMGEWRATPVPASQPIDGMLDPWGKPVAFVTPAATGPQRVPSKKPAPVAPPWAQTTAKPLVFENPADDFDAAEKAALAAHPIDRMLEQSPNAPLVGSKWQERESEYTTIYQVHSIANSYFSKPKSNDQAITVVYFMVLANEMVYTLPLSIWHAVMRELNHG